MSGGLIPGVALDLWRAWLVTMIAASCLDKPARIVEKSARFKSLVLRRSACAYPRGTVEKPPACASLGNQCAWGEAFPLLRLPISRCCSYSSGYEEGVVPKVWWNRREK